MTLKELDAAERRIRTRDRSGDSAPLEDSYTDESNPDSVCRDGETMEDRDGK